MSELSVDLTWNRKESELLPGQFSSEHEVIYNENFKVTADTAPDWGGSSSKIAISELLFLLMLII